jgi:hypothetical protein
MVAKFKMAANNIGEFTNLNGVCRIQDGGQQCEHTKPNIVAYVSSRWRLIVCAQYTKPNMVAKIQDGGQQ